MCGGLRVASGGGRYHPDLGYCGVLRWISRTKLSVGPVQGVGEWELKVNV